MLVLGGPHADAAAVRERVIESGGLVAVNLTASVTDVVCLPGGETDRRMTRIRSRGLPVTTAETFLRLLENLAAGGPRPPGGTTASEPRALVRGAVVDLPTAAVGTRWTVAANWAWDSTVEIDLVAFLVGVDELVSDDDDVVFFNQPRTDDGAAALSVDGPSEQAIALDLALLPSSVHRVVVAALGDGRTFGEIGPVSVAARTPDGLPWLNATMDAATTEQPLILAEVYRRNGLWRSVRWGRATTTDLLHWRAPTGWTPRTDRRRGASGTTGCGAGSRPVLPGARGRVMAGSLPCRRRGEDAISWST
ncbi:TerD family protein [Parafrankia sp. FMc2]|uniref:TerD family protein n=1 Tax=Parafrankia sp. FMc2 TaxID=3233196 RepID=UPI0034D72EAF